MSETTVLKSRIPQNNAGQSLIDFLSNRFKYHTREEWIALIQKGSVCLNGTTAGMQTLLAKNDVVSYEVILREPPVDTGLKIIHEEETFLIAYKPGNLPSHADGNFIKNTFIYLIKEEMKKKGYQGTLSLVHRLDRETSGLMVVSKTPEVSRMLTRQFEEGSVDKEYIAVVRGVVQNSSFEVSGAITRDMSSTISIKKIVVQEGTPHSKPSCTRFEVIKQLKSATVVLCKPLTGRTNQIRIHLCHAGYPIVGDKLYGRTDEEFLEFLNRMKQKIYEPLPWQETARQLLHASKLAFNHPITNKRIVFEYPMPEDMRAYIIQQEKN